MSVDSGLLRLTLHGAQRFPRAASKAALHEIEQALPSSNQDRAGVRLYGIAELRPLLGPAGEVGRLAAQCLGVNVRPVRAILFDKTAGMNWSLAWHQDRTIVVEHRTEVEGFGPWSVKSGWQHVEPPFDLLSRMITVRVHLDAVLETNAPLLVAPGSHACGRVPHDQVLATVRRCGSVACLAKQGDAWVYATSILHASEASKTPERRRVLQVDYSADDLPGGLCWAGVY